MKEANRNLIMIIQKKKNNNNNNKAIAMMRRKSPPSENILYLIANHCQTNNISKGRRGKALILFS